MNMKHLFVLIGLFLAMSVNAQSLQLDKLVATYYAQDSTTFFLGAAKGKKAVLVDFTTVNKPDIEFRIGSTVKEADGTFQCAGYLAFTPEGTSTSVDSILLDTVAYAQTIKTSAGTRYTTYRIFLHYSDGIPTDNVALTFFWGTATTGRVKVYF